MLTTTTSEFGRTARATVAFESYLAGVVEGWLGIPESEVFGAGTEPLDLQLT